MSPEKFHSILSFWGNAKVKDQVTHWNKHIKDSMAEGATFNSSNEFKIFLTKNNKLIFSDDYFLTIDNQISQPLDDEMGLLSIGARPESIETYLACKLYKLDKNIVIRNSFHTDSGVFGVSYTAAYNSEESYSQFVTINCDYDEFEFPEDAISDAEERLEEAENEIIEYFVDDMPGTKSKFKKNIRKGRIDWDSI